MRLFNVTFHQNSKLDSLRIGSTFQIENLLSLQKSLKAQGNWFVKYNIQKQNYTRFM